MSENNSSNKLKVTITFVIDDVDLELYKANSISEAATNLFMWYSVDEAEVVNDLQHYDINFTVEPVNE